MLQRCQRQPCYKDYQHVAAAFYAAADRSPSHEQDVLYKHGVPKPNRERCLVYCVAGTDAGGDRGATGIACAVYGQYRQRFLFGAPAAQRRPFKTSTPCYLPRQHNDEALHASSDERFFNPTRGSLHYKAYLQTGRRRSGPTVRAAVRELDALWEELSLC